MTSPIPRTGLIATAMILFWPVGLAALFAMDRAARAEGAGDADGARHEGRLARRRAWLGVVLGGVLLALGLAGGLTVAVRQTPALQALLSDPTTPVRSAAETEQTTLPVDVLDLRTGDCFLAPSTELDWNDLSTVEVLSCGDVHDAVVIAAHEHEEADYPGGEAVRTATLDTCAAASWQYLGTDSPQYPDVRLKMPSESGWERGYRTSVCVLVASEPVRGSLRDRPDLVDTAPQDGADA